jgi:GT2 family glycosyltransferase
MRDNFKNISQKNILPKNSSQKAEYSELLNAVKSYEERIKEIEGSTYWKIYLFLTKTKLILTSDSYLKNDKWRFFQRIRFLFSKPGLLLIAKFIRQLFSLIFGKVNNFIGLSKGFEKVNYEQYKEKNFPRESDLEAMTMNIGNFDVQPHIQIYAIVNQQNYKFINTFLSSLETQVYTHFFVTFVLDKPSEKMMFTIKKIADSDYKYSYINNEDIINNKPELDCEYALFVKLNSILRADCLYQIVNEINAHSDADFIYSDNDFIYNHDDLISSNPYFKPKWSPHTILSRNYVGKLFLISKNIYNQTALKGMENIYSLVLTYSSSAQSIQHVSKILYHEIKEDLTSEKIQNDHQSLNDFLLMKYQNGHARLSDASLGCFEPVFQIDNPLVSIIIPSKNKSSILDACIQSIMNLSTYKNFEIIIIDNGSEEKTFFTSVANWEFQYPEQIKCYKMDIPFNYSILNNKAAEYAKGEYLLFLNNDTELISGNLIEELIKIAQLKDVGAVGPKLLYPNNTIQHAGIVLSLGDTGEHIYSGAHKDTAGYFNNTNCLTNYAAVTGACMMIKKERFDEVGGFDVGLAVDCNDVELCCRLYTAGYHNVYVPWVRMYHYECLTRGNPIISNQSLIKQSEEKQYFINKWGPLIKNDPYYNKNLTRISKKYELKHV